MNLTKILEPITIGTVEVKNRVVRTAHDTALAGMQSGFGRAGVLGEIGDAFVAYHRERARGGVGLTILEVAGVHPTSPTAITAWDTRVIPQYERLMKAIKPHGMHVFQQLYHSGHHVMSDAIPTSPWSASDVPSVTAGLVPRPMTTADIAELLAGFAQTARNVREGGLDGIEIHAAHGYLIGQFLSPLTNRRTDEYGGSFNNRMRLLHEVVAAVRGAVGDDYPVGLRLSSSEMVPGGLRPGDTRQVAEEIAAHVDFVDVSMGVYISLPKIIGGLHEPLGYELASAREVTSVVDVPTIVAGRIQNLAQGNEIIESGIADMVGMVRATIADPHIVRKTIGGRRAEVRPCIYCNQGCIGGYERWGHIGCAINPSAAHETVTPYDSPPPAAESLRVAVIGAGPAGLEAARVAALRGHKVTLVEREDHLGGRMHLARRAPHADALGAFVDWMGTELERLNVTLRLGTHADAAMVESLEPDRVVVATGAVPRRDGLQAARPALKVPGVDSPHVVTSTEVFDDRSEWGDTAVVLDDVGHYEAIACAEELRAKDVNVTFVTRFSTLGTKLQASLRDEPARRRLSGPGFAVVPFSYVGEIGVGWVDVMSLEGDGAIRYPAETVVLVSFATPVRTLADELVAGGRFIAPIVVGDAVTPRDLLSAVHEAHAALRNV